MNSNTKFELVEILKEYAGSLSYGATGSPIDRKRKRITRMIKKISKIVCVDKDTASTDEF